MRRNHKYAVLKNNFEGALIALSNKKFQEETWVKGNLNFELEDEDTSFSNIGFAENINCLYDSGNFLDAIADGKIFYNEEVTNAALELDEIIEIAIDEIDSDISDKDIFYDPLMQNLRQKAKTLLHLLRTTKPSKDNEVKIIKEFIDGKPVYIENFSD